MLLSVRIRRSSVRRLPGRVARLLLLLGRRSSPVGGVLLLWLLLRVAALVGRLLLVLRRRGTVAVRLLLLRGRGGVSSVRVLRRRGGRDGGLMRGRLVLLGVRRSGAGRLLMGLLVLLVRLLGLVLLLLLLLLLMLLPSVGLGHLVVGDRTVCAESESDRVSAAWRRRRLSWRNEG